MDEEDVWEGVKTSVILVGGIFLAFLAVLGLEYYGLIETGIGLDSRLFIFLIGALLASGIATFFLDQADWI